MRCEFNFVVVVVVPFTMIIFLWVRDGFFFVFENENQTEAVATKGILFASSVLLVNKKKMPFN